MPNVGDKIAIEDRVIDHEVAQALTKNDNKRAVRWESYRSVLFIVEKVYEDGSIVFTDNHGHRVSLSITQFEVIP